MTLYEKYLKSSFSHGRPYAFCGKMVCAYCSKYQDAKTGLIEYAITEPVFLIVKVNKKSGEKFLGCPNFPKCKYSEDVLSIRQWKTRIKDFSFDYSDELRPY